MSLVALHESEASACSDLGLNRSDFDVLIEAQRTKVHDLGEISVQVEVELEGGGTKQEALSGHSYLGLSGPTSQMAKGGSMATVMTLEQAQALAEERPEEMGIKNSAFGLVDVEGRPIRGGKLITATDHHPLLTPEAYKAYYRELAKRMHDQGLIGYGIYSTAGDKNTNFDWLMDSFVQGYHGANPDDLLYQVAATGTSEAEHGFKFRGLTTGWGVYNTTRFAKERWGNTHSPDTVAIQGAGSVGLWTAHFASKDPGMRVDAISDLGGMLYVKNRINGSPSMDIDRELVEHILSHPRLDKIATLKAAIEQKQPYLDLGVVSLEEDPDAILGYEADWFIPAAAVEGEVLRRDNIGKLRARLGVVEGGNGTTDADAHRELLRLEKRVIPGEAANSDGVSCSMKQIHAIVRAILHGEKMPSEEQVLEELRTERFALLGNIVDLGKHLGTEDYRRATTDLAIGRMAMNNGIPIDSGLKQYMLAQAA